MKRKKKDNISLAENVQGKVSIFLGMANRVLRSMWFNCVMLTIGFIIGFFFTYVKFTYIPSDASVSMCINEIEQMLRERRIIDKQIDAQVEAIKKEILKKRGQDCVKYIKGEKHEKEQ